MSEAICNWMTYEHHVVESAFDGQDAIDMLRSFPFDLIILDWQLPSMSGVEVLQQFRARGGMAPVLMLTGKDTMQDKQEGFESGADDYLVKPFNVKELVLRVRALLRMG